METGKSVCTNGNKGNGDFKELIINDKRVILLLSSPCIPRKYHMSSSDSNIPPI